MIDIWQRPGRLICILAFAASACIFSAYGNMAAAQSIVVLVNDDPVTSYDVAQRQRLLALSSNLGARMKERIQSEETKQAFQQYMQEKRPQSREEAKVLQKKFIERIQKTVIASAGQSMRKRAIDELVEERLMIQAARKLKITVSDDEVDKFLTRMAQAGKDKRTLKQFLARFKTQGINPSTLKERIRAQAAWRQVVRRVYGSLVQASSPNNIPIHNAGGGTIVDVEIVRLKVKGGQKAAAAKLIEAEKIRKNFKSCNDLKKQLSDVSDATIQSVKKANLSDFRGDAQAVLQKAKAGEMAPAIVKGRTIELHALCAKKTIEPSNDASQNHNAADETKEKFQLYSRRHLKDIKARALLKYPKSG